MISNNNLSFGNSIVTGNKQIFIRETVMKLNNIEGSICEVGVYKGGTAKLIFESMNKAHKLFLFDTFSGIPNKSEFDNFHKIGDFYDSPYDEIINYFSKYNNVEVYKGIFPNDTGFNIQEQKFKLVHLDVDTYQSYLESLNFIYPRMVKGGYIIFDDYNEPSCQGATIAVDKFFLDKPEKIQNDTESYFIIKQ